MNVYRNQIGRYSGPKGLVWAIGNCDGLHLGHRALINLAEKKAEILKGEAGLITFEPLPQQYFGAPEPSRISQFEVKLKDLKQLGLKHLIVLPFNKKLADLSAAAFIDDFLIKELQTQAVVIGDDFRFGQGRLGNASTLQQSSAFDTVVLPTVLDQEKRVSSTRIRELLLNGSLQEANRLLTKPFEVCGRVKAGKGLGRTLQAATANIKLEQRLTLAFGVYLVKICLKKTKLWGVANYGVRPTVNGQSEELEVHMLDFNQSIYGEKLWIQMIEPIRGENKFNSLQALQAQIQQDIKDAREQIKRYESH